MQEKLEPEPGWTAEIGADGTVVMRHGPDGDIFTLDSRAAARLGVALLAVSVINNGPALRPPVGTIIDSVHFPVIAWSVGRSAANGEPVLLVTVTGGPTLMLQLTGSSSLAAGEALVREAKSAVLPAGQKPN